MISPITSTFTRNLADDDNATALGDFLSVIARPTLGGTLDEFVFTTPVDLLFDMINLHNRQEHFELADLFADRSVVRRKYYVSLSVTRSHFVFTTYELPEGYVAD